jgi:transposase
MRADRDSLNTGGVDRLCTRVERLLNRCKPFRRLATRDEKRAAHYQAMWLITATIVWLEAL